MNLYFLVEGNSTEKKIYPQWLKFLIPELTRVKYYDEVVKNNYYLISGQGYPAILHDGLDNAIDKLKEVDKYDYLVICVDVDEETVQERYDYMTNFIKNKQVNLGSTQIKIILQNRCIETWLLGNKTIFNSRQPQQKPLSDYRKYHDVSKLDPELMGSYNLRNHADFHYKYLQEIFKAKNISYTKRNPHDAKEEYYLEELKKRIGEDVEHLNTFQEFINFCNMIRGQIF
ncbi:DUF4276 family protein [Cyanobacterium aponinum FACHB-4101]|uniref:DUF4276 family protein n=1 Tax=Cyanobacterium aponinum TaxID=379064 RepID=UPI001680E525|nr:DUF4276 family protein [Cyanobacterium aponinum]MBD2393730.1 DUF4276 family protein [Cyanobacterium aponinum FACHB-4101]